MRSLAWMSAGLLTLSLLARAAPPPRGSLTIERIAEIKYPTDQAWSPDSKTIAFLWDAAGKQDLFTVQPGSKPVPLTDFPVAPETLRSDIGHFEWLSANEIVFVKDGGLYRVSTESGKPSRMPGFDGVTVFALTHDHRQIAFVKKGQVWIGSLDGKIARQLSHIADGYRITTVVPAPDAKWVAFTAQFAADTPDPLPFNGDRVQVLRSSTWGAVLGMVSVYGADPVLIPVASGGRNGAPQWVAGGAVLHQETSADRKTREIRVTTVEGESRTIWKDYDPAWWSPSNSPKTVVSPDGKWVGFVCDRSGWPLVYVLPTNAKSETEGRPVSFGHKIDGFPSWSADSRRIAYSSSQDGDEMSRYISVAEIANAGQPSGVEEIVKEPGVSLDPVFSPDGAMIAFSRSSATYPLEVFAASAQGGSGGSKIERLTDSLPAEIKVADLTAPVPIWYPSRGDRKPVPATLMVNKSLDKTVKHPAIIWVHGSGDGQNYLGWQPGAWRMYYAMHQYLAQQGYVILTVDYRGNSGYSREWATGDYADPGGTETGDVNAGADYLKTLPYVDPDRIGVWGLSYGGYMVMQSLVVDPKLFNCAIDVAGVGDWATYNLGVATRLGSNPSEDPALWDRSSPVRHLDKLERPLLILQGTADVNVPFWETLKVVDTLEKLGKPFELMIYPGEPHWFRRSYVLRDAWRRSEQFFNEHLIPEQTTNASASAGS